MVVMASDGPSPHFASLHLGLLAPQPSRRHHAQSLLGPSFHDSRMHHVLESHPEQTAPLSRRRAAMMTWQYQKYSTILILVLCLLCVTPLVCSSYSSFAPSSPQVFFSSWWQEDYDLFTHTLRLVLPCSPSTSLRQPQTTRWHVLWFADSRITLRCHALRICVAHAPSESCPISLLVH